VIRHRGWWLLLALPLGSAQGQSLAYEGGVSFGSGNYIFTTRTTSWTLASGVALATGPFTWRVGFPVYLQNTSLVTGSGVGMMPSGGGSGSGVVAGGGGMMGSGGSGMDRLTPPSSAVTGYRVAPGDPTVHVAWRALRGARTGVTVGAGVKIPATDTASYGTGAWDVGATLSLVRHVGGAGFLGLDLSYWHLGDLPDLDFHDPVIGTLSANRLFGASWGGSVFVTAGSAALPGYDAPLMVGASLTRLGDTRSWGLMGAVGLTDTVPEFTVGVTWRVGR
jgi:hypothetical protein